MPDPLQDRPPLAPPELPKFLRFKKHVDRREANVWALASSMGLALVLSIVMGAALGYWLDSKLDTRPWLSLAGLLTGLAAGFKNLFVISARIERKSRELAEEKKARAAEKRHG